MSDYLVTDTELTSIADAIRTKGGTSADLSFPTGFVSAINAISGGGGLEYEEGTWTPTTDTNGNDIEIPFQNTHTEPPSIVIISDTTNTLDTNTYTLHSWAFIDFYKLFGFPFMVKANNNVYSAIFMARRMANSSGMVDGYWFCNYPWDNTSEGINFSCYYANKTRICPFGYYSNYYWRANRTYKWIAIWT